MSAKKDLLKIKYDPIYVELPMDDVEALKTVRRILDFFIERMEAKKP